VTRPTENLHTPPYNVPVTNPLQVGLVGFGLAGRVFHAPLIHANPNLRLTHIVQRHGDEAAQKYPHAEIVRDVDTLLAQKSVNLVVVATPNTSHYDIAARALAAGKHVVVDKPFTITSREADELIDLARRSVRVLSVFQNRRWDGDFLTVREILDQRLLGRLAEYESRFDRFRPAIKENAWREQETPGSGVLFDLGSHLIDQAMVLFGPPATIYGDLRKQRDGAMTVDNFEVHLGYSNLKVTLKAASLACEPSPRFVLYGTEGSYTKFGLDPQEEALRQGHSPAESGWGEDAPEAWGTLTRCDGAMNRQKYRTLPGRYPDYYSNVYRAITGSEELAVKPEQARDVIRLIELAEQSAREGKMIPVV
jgi:scyllo-inositol 2-dehydrogenase (NADP+)